MDVWESFWKNSFKQNSLATRFHHSTVFDAYKKMLDPLNLKNPEIAELGCGSAELTARLLERYSGSATLVDKSSSALVLAKENFKKQGIKAKFLEADLFKMNSGKKYNIVHSEGLIEHFIGKQQKKIVQVHKKFAKKDGFVLICVPRPSRLYKIWRRWLESRGKWLWGFERPMDEKELKLVLERAGLKVLKTSEQGRFSFALAH